LGQFPDFRTASNGTGRGGDASYLAPRTAQLAWRTYSITSSATARTGWNGQAQRLGGLEVDDQLELCRLHDRQVSGLLALQNAAGVNADLAIGVG
jgi:hypothetical protein